MNSLQLLYLDNGSHDFVNQNPSEAISSFIIVLILSRHCTPFFSAANLDDKLNRGRRTPLSVVSMANQGLQNRKANLNINQQSQDVMVSCS